MSAQKSKARFGEGQGGRKERASPRRVREEEGVGAEACWIDAWWW